MSHFVKNTQCPACAKQGKDESHDNLGNYSDGSVYCWSCGYFKSATASARIKEKQESTTTTATKTVCLPGDVHFQLPGVAWDYLQQYALTKEDIYENRIMWSDHWERLIFPYFDGTGLLGWQGRYLGNKGDKAKWYSQGDLKNILHICGKTAKSSSEQPIVLVEDVISAIRVGHVNPCAPLFGSHISTQNALRYNQLYKTIILWLDLDKQKDSLQFAKKLNALGINTRCIITEKDPKEYNKQEIVDFLNKMC